MPMSWTTVKSNLLAGALAGLVALALPASAARAAAITVHACGGANEWPPSSYFVRRQGQPTTEVAGFSPDVLAAALQGSGFAPQVAMQPFARCLAEARAGVEIQVVMAAFYNDERAKAFLYSDPYLLLNPRAYFLSARWPGGLSLTTLKDLERYQLCGLNGISYAHLGAAAQQVYTGAQDYASLVRMLRAARCDVFVESEEVIQGFRLLGHAELMDPQLASAPIPGVLPLQGHFIVSRNYPQAQALLDAINSGLQRLRRGNQLAPMLHKHQATN
jgi:polar amino acid transport system substrate-binding protein